MTEKMADVVVLSDSAKQKEPAIGEHLTDMGNARRFIALHQERVRYVSQWGWLVWDGRRWERDTTGAVDRLAKHTVKTIYGEAARIGDPAQRRAIAKHAVKSEACTRLRAMLELAKTEREVVARPDDFNQKQFVLQCKNGRLDLRTGHIEKAQPEDLDTRMVAATFNPEAEAPAFRRFLSEIMAADAAMIRFLQRVLGYSLTGSTREQALFVFWGTGANGKTTLLELIADLMGDYAARTPSDTLMASRYGRIPNDIARLEGRRFVIATESENNRRLNESLVKRLTGGDKIAARFLRKEFFEFRPEFKLFIGTNYKPVIQGQDHAIWRRIRLIPCTVQLPPEKQDRALPEKLRKESAGILNWLLEGCLEWQRDGLGTPSSVRDAVGRYRASQDVLRAFLADRCIVKKDATATASALYQTYENWCAEVGEEPGNKTWFGSKLREREFEPGKGARGVRLWKGIGLLQRGS